MAFPIWDILGSDQVRVAVEEPWILVGVGRERDEVEDLGAVLGED